MADIALDLGYGENAAFTKAFRRWAGVSPSRYRRMARASSLPVEVDSGQQPRHFEPQVARWREMTAADRAEE